MDSWCYFSGDKEFVFDKSVSASRENGGKNSGVIALSEAEKKPSSLVVDSNRSRDSSMVDLKLGSTLNSTFVNRNLSYAAAKRSQIPFCQVHGCKKDLRSSKDYHKKHKVCEVHSKTAKVIVKGVEQRFCQQCSRFHLLAEFDKEKRSCRKRLAGHNERRRKPRVGVNSTTLGMFQDYNGSRFHQGTTSTSSIVLHQQRACGKQHLPLHVGENSALTRMSKIDEIDELPLQDQVTCSYIGSPFVFYNSSEGSKNSTFVDSSSSSYFEELNSGHSLSLLSSLSQNISSDLSPRTCSSHPLVTSYTSEACCDLSSKASQSSQQ